MTPPLAEQLRGAKVYDLEQPRFAGMPIHPSHRPGYFYALHRRHRDTIQPEKHGPRSGASGTPEPGAKNRDTKSYSVEPAVTITPRTGSRASRAWSGSISRTSFSDDASTR